MEDRNKVSALRLLPEVGWNLRVVHREVTEDPQGRYRKGAHFCPLNGCSLDHLGFSRFVWFLVQLERSVNREITAALKVPFPKRVFMKMLAPKP